MERELGCYQSVTKWGRGPHRALQLERPVGKADVRLTMPEKTRYGW